MADQPLDTLSAQLASAFVRLLTELQKMVNAATAAGEMSAEAGHEMTEMIIESAALPRAVADSAKAHNVKSKRSAEARRRGVRSSAFERTKKVRARDLELLAAAKDIR